MVEYLRLAKLLMADFLDVDWIDLSGRNSSLVRLGSLFPQRMDLKNL